MTTRGQRIRRARNLRRMTMQELADAVGIGERTLRSIERDERPDARTIGLVEAYLGIEEPLPSRSASPPLHQATDAEIALEILRRLDHARSAGRGDGPLPEDVRDEPGLIVAPPDDVDGTGGTHVP